MFIIHAIATYFRTACTTRALSALDDRTLADIGISREHIQEYARQWAQMEAADR